MYCLDADVIINVEFAGWFDCLYKSAKDGHICFPEGVYRQLTDTSTKIGNKIENPGLVTKIVISRYNYEGKENPVDKSKEITITIKQLKDLFNFFLSGREGSFRYLIYDVMGFEPKDYCNLDNTNLIRFNNYFCELKEKAESFEKLQKDL